MLSEPTRVWHAPLSALNLEVRAAFEKIDMGSLWPEVGSRMMSRMVTGQDLRGAWIIVQEGVYRYAIAQAGAMLVRSVIGEYLSAEVYWDA